MMGFPTWTLWGMGLAAIGSLVATLLAYLAQSPRFLARAGLNARQMQLRSRGFVGITLALQLLALGFFVAGVPLDRGQTAVAEVPTAIPTETPATAGEIVALSVEDVAATAAALVTATAPTATATSPQPIATTPATGAFGGGLATPRGSDELGAPNPSPATATATPTPDGFDAPNPTATPTADGLPTANSIPSPTETPTATATLAATATPTVTPAPTVTPTPISGATAVVSVGETGAVSLQRVPGGDTLDRLVSGDVVILQSGHANFGGELWHEVRTVGGILGWVPDAALVFGDGGEQ